MKGRKDFYTENYQIILKEIKGNQNKWRNISCSWIGRFNIIKISILLKLMHKFNARPIEIQAGSKMHVEIKEKEEPNQFWKKE